MKNDFECDNCGEENTTTQPREDGMNECDRCWEAALAHGHRHGLHQDEDGNDIVVAGCPICESAAPTK